jgi:hypothetical protein
VESRARLSTRRRLLKTGAVALGAAGLAELAGWERLIGGRPAASAPVRRCVSLGANGVINPGSTQDYRSCRAFLRETGTRWVRIWADWPSLQPEASGAPDAGSGAWRVRELDAQLALARSDGVRVILTAYRFPTWANGTAELTGPADASHGSEDRVPRLGDLSSRKDLRFKLPTDVGPGSAWARFVEFLLSRYGRAIAALDLVNEPNAQVWPLHGPSPSADPYARGPLSAHRTVAQMFATAQGIARRLRSPVRLIGPSTSDTSDDSRLAVPFDEFTRALLGELDRSGFEPDRGFAWSHHNYTDVEHDRTQTSVEAVIDLLRGRWSEPALLVPEGGARLTKIASVYGTLDPGELRTLQAELIGRNWNRMTRVRGLAMLGQYLFYSDPTFDCGLCEVDGTRRPAYATWGALPSRA